MGFNDFHCSLPVEDEFDVDFNPDNVALNSNRLNYILAANFEGGKNCIPIHGLLGGDLIRFMVPMQITECMNGSVWQIPERIIPFGSVKKFLEF